MKFALFSYIFGDEKSSLVFFWGGGLLLISCCCSYFTFIMLNYHFAGFVKTSNIFLLINVAISYLYRIIES